MSSKRVSEMTDDEVRALAGAVTSPQPVPPQAITAAAETLSQHIESGEMRPRILARLMLNAAAPHLAAAEREACAQLAEQAQAVYPEFTEETVPGHPGRQFMRQFASLLREARP